MSQQPQHAEEEEKEEMPADRATEDDNQRSIIGDGDAAAADMVADGDIVASLSHPGSVNQSGEEEDRQAHDSNTDTDKEEAVGVTSDGQRFLVPETFDCVDTLSFVKKWSEVPVILQLAIIGFYFFAILLKWPTWFFTLSFIFWRLCYNCGLGFILYRQSKYRDFSRLMNKWLSIPVFRDWFERNISTKTYFMEGKKYPDGKRYNVNAYPADFTTWMAYRSVVDIVLCSDLVAYFAFCLTHFEAPESFGWIDIPLYLFGISLMFFNLWAKSDAHRVLGDYAWYWGDFYFLLDKTLIFDGIFQMFPHPMYTVGYSFFYGLSIVTRSHTVLIVSFLAHMLQLLFLMFVENPHIEKTYGAMKSTENSTNPKAQQVLETYFDTRSELVAFKHIDIFRASDFFLVVIALYMVLITVLDVSPWVHVMHVILWRLFHTVGLGYILERQSKSKWWTRRWEKKGKNNREAFESWKRLYNASITLGHIAFVGCFFKFFHIPGHSSFFGIAVKMVGGAILIGINIWGSVSAYEVLGNFGWFYGDFFIDEYPQTLYYTGIYRYLNNPETVLGFAAYYGLALISSSWTMPVLAVICHLAQHTFVVLVEKPHMCKRYGKERMRSKGGISLGITQQIKKLDENAQVHHLIKRLDTLRQEVEELKDARAVGALREMLAKTIEQVRVKTSQLVTPPTTPTVQKHE